MAILLTNENFNSYAEKVMNTKAVEVKPIYGKAKILPYKPEPKKSKFRVPDIKYNDGGRSAAGFEKDKVGDCVARSIAIVTQRPYAEIYKLLAEGNAKQRVTKRQRRTKKAMQKAHKETADFGISVKRKWFQDLMKDLGFTWVSVMGIGTGVTMHMRHYELPPGRIIASLSKHYCAVINRVVHDTYDPCRGGNRAVYGYWEYDEDRRTI